MESSGGSRRRTGCGVGSAVVAGPDAKIGGRAGTRFCLDAGAVPVGSHVARYRPDRRVRGRGICGPTLASPGRNHASVGDIAGERERDRPGDYGSCAHVLRAARDEYPGSTDRRRKRELHRPVDPATDQYHRVRLFYRRGCAASGSAAGRISNPHEDNRITHCLVVSHFYPAESPRGRRLGARAGGIRLFGVETTAPPARRYLACSCRYLCHRGLYCLGAGNLWRFRLRLPCNRPQHRHPFRCKDINHRIAARC